MESFAVIPLSEIIGYNIHGKKKPCNWNFFGNINLGIAMAMKEVTMEQNMETSEDLTRVRQMLNNQQFPRMMGNYYE